MTTEPTTRPLARLGYAIEDLQAFHDAGERRVAGLHERISEAEARLVAARRETVDPPALRRSVAEEWIRAWEHVNGDPRHGHRTGA